MVFERLVKSCLCIIEGEICTARSMVLHVLDTGCTVTVQIRVSVSHHANRQCDTVGVIEVTKCPGQRSEEPG